MNVSRARVLPVVILALVALAGLKAANLWVGFAAAEAAPASADPEAAPLAEAPPLQAMQSEAERRILEQLAGRRGELDAREESIETREKLLEAAEQRLEQRFETLAREEASIAAQAAERDRQKAAEFESLSDAYERMKPRDAARIFEVLEEDVLVPVAAGMRTQALSGVLAEMDPARAKTLTRLLADYGRQETMPPESP